MVLTAAICVALAILAASALVMMTMNAVILFETVSQSDSPSTGRSCRCPDTSSPVPLIQIRFPILKVRSFNKMKKKSSSTKFTSKSLVGLVGFTWHRGIQDPGEGVLDRGLWSGGRPVRNQEWRNEGGGPATSGMAGQNTSAASQWTGHLAGGIRRRCSFRRLHCAIPGRDVVPAGAAAELNQALIF